MGNIVLIDGVELIFLASNYRGSGKNMFIIQNA